MTLHREELRGSNFVEVTFRGNMEEVLAAVSAYFGDYHPLGYGTAVKKIWHTGGAAGPYEATMWRAKSCD